MRSFLISELRFIRGVQNFSCHSHEGDSTKSLIDTDVNMEDPRHIEEKVADLGKLDEEFCNFMHRVTEVESIVKKLASKDKEVQTMGDEEAKRYLKEESTLSNIDEETIKLNVTVNKTLINKKALSKEDNSNSNEMSKESFMEEVSKDAEKRYQDKLIRREKMETFKKQATKAFRNKDYEKALVLYNKAIEQIKDSPLLYNNRALTYIKLGLLDKAKNDLEDWALRLNEDCLKTWLLLAKVSFLAGDQQELERCIAEAKNRNPVDVDFIEDYVKNSLQN